MEESSTNQHDIFPYSKELNLFIAVCAILFAVVGTTGNLLSAVALLRSPRLRSQAATVFVVSLCFSDLLFCSLILPLYAAHFLLGAWPLGDTACSIFTFGYYSTVAASLTSISAITVNRYVLIVHPGLYPQVYTRRNLCFMLAAVWSFGPLLMLLPLTGAWGRLGRDSYTGQCTVLADHSHSAGPKLFLLLAGALSCGTIIVYCYARIYSTAKRSRQAVQAHNPRNSLMVPEQVPAAAQSSGSSPCRRDDRRLTRMILIIFLCFIACFTPYLLVNFVDVQGRRWPVLQVLAYLPIWFASTVNPFIYAVSNRQYQRAFCECLCKHRLATPPPSGACSDTAPSNISPGTQAFRLKKYHPNNSQ